MIDTAIILAVCMGTRLVSISNDRPTGFIAFDGQTLIDRTLKLLNKNGVTKMIIGTGGWNYYL